MKKLKKIIIVLLLITIIIIITIIGINLVTSLKEQEKIENEVKEIKKHLTEHNIDPEQIKKYQEETITTKDRIVVEDAIEQYSYDLAIALSKTNKVLKDDTFKMLLTTKNYNEDAPNFIKSKAYIKNTITELERCKNEILNFTEKSKIESYIKDKKISEYNKELYIKLAQGEAINVNDAKNFENAIDELIKLLENSDKMLDLLIKAKGNWYTQGEEIIFTNQDYINEYNNIVNKIEKIK